MGRGPRSGLQNAAQMSRSSTVIAGQQIRAQIVTDNLLVRPIVERLRTLPELAIDFETTLDQGEFGPDYGPPKGRIRLIQVGYHNPRSGVDEQLIFDSFAVDIQPIAELLSDPKVTKVVHFSPFETAWARHHLKSEFENLEDTCFAAQSINKEMRTRVAREIDSQNANELQGLLGRGESTLENGTTYTPAQITEAENKIKNELIKKLGDDQQGLGASINNWHCNERARLLDLCQLYLNEELPKDCQASDWGQQDLSAGQLNYAAADAAITLALAPKIRALGDALAINDKVQTRIKLDRERALS